MSTEKKEMPASPFAHLGRRALYADYDDDVTPEGVEQLRLKAKEIMSDDGWTQKPVTKNDAAPVTKIQDVTKNVAAPGKRGRPKSDNAMGATERQRAARARKRAAKG